ncbi:MAG: hypothetical protein EOP04_07555 [Proteobacteria bacterium]|nr:MAG: hypothetical protein EOP04_07555 [Pseudomonadota bacterium]
MTFQLFVMFWELDNWPVFVSLRGSLSSSIGCEEWAFQYFEGPLEYVMAFGVLFAAKVLGVMVGVRAVEEARTPVALWDAYRSRKVQSSSNNSLSELRSKSFSS